MHSYRLVRLSGPRGRDLWPLPAGSPTIVGRDDRTDDQLSVDLSPDRRVSRRHARLWFENDSWWIEDLGSKRGTLLGGHLIPIRTPVRYEPETEIRLGGTLLTIFDREWHRLYHDPWVLDLRVSAKFNLAIALVGIRLIPRLVVRNWGEAPTPAAQLDLALPGFAQAKMEIPRLSAGQSRALEAPLFDLDEAALLGVTDQQWCALEVRVKEDRLSDRHLGCTVLAANELAYTPEHRTALAAFVVPGHPAVIQATREATAGLTLATDAASVLRRLYEYLSTSWRIDYRKDPPSAKSGTQKLRSAVDVLWNPNERVGEGTCIDLALLIAACLEACRRPPLVILVDLGRSWHAIVGCWQQARRRLDFLPADRQILLNEAVWVDPNGCTREPSQHATFTAAGERARDYLTRWPLALALDIAAARGAGIRPLPVRVREKPVPPL